jgi:hypothetical protein
LLGSLAKSKQLVPHKLGVAPEQASWYPSAKCTDKLKFRVFTYDIWSNLYLW